MSSRSDDEIRAGYVHHGELAEHALAAAPDPAIDDETRDALRTSGLVHRYFELLEHPDEPIEPFASIFAKEIDFDFTMTKIETLDQFGAWATDFRSSFECFTLTVVDVEVERIDAAVLVAHIDLDFDAVGIDGDRKTMQTTHRWTIENDTIAAITVNHREQPEAG